MDSIFCLPKYHILYTRYYVYMDNQDINDDLSEISKGDDGNSSDIFVDPNLCLGCGTCVAIAPEAFEFAEDGKSQYKSGHKYDDQTIEDAIEACPVGAIKKRM